MKKTTVYTVFKALASLLLLLMTAWGGFALWYHVAGGAAVREEVVLLWAALGIATLALWWRRRSARVLLPWLTAMAIMMAWWSMIAPGSNLIWSDDVAREINSRVDGSVVTLDNVRNFDWRSDTDYTPRWETRSYDLDQLRAIDVAMSYWMGPAVAHTLVSFAFADGRHLTFSIEIRKQRGESFSAVAGFFKHFQMVLVAADERDILRVRTNARGEDMYLYRVKMPAADMRSLFLSYLGEADQLKRQPRYYNTLTANCTTVVFEMVRRIDPGLPLDWRLLASGYLDRYLYDIGALAGSGDFAARKQAAHITARAIAAGTADDFSERIRR
ncbi:DUF4105 domain-containing protein [Rugamonas sp.]|uniref:Lnb N-terminal periplasmic domain-containing protein n=1 Tax=Rugamonas sp. TaxID=1926287 RepID=UPI0025D54FD8|nr:DUF4105 domain-containing protein [Rugamonas sp.]